MILYDGYLDATRPYSIYANALWGYDVIANRLSRDREQLDGGASTVLPRGHDESHALGPPLLFLHAIAPEQNRLYLWGGANNSISTGWSATPGSTISRLAWREITVSTHPTTSSSRR